MKKNTTKLTALALSAAMLLSICSLSGCAQTKQDEILASSLANTAVTQPVSDGTATPEKEETVYVLSQPDGAVSELIVSNWLKNSGRTASLEDATELKNIENVNGTESFTANGHNRLTWDAQGQDIYYQGTTDKQLPVTMTVSYTLNGTPISPEKLAGQSGAVTIRFDYENHETRKVNVNGKQETIFVPFIMATGTMLDNEIFRNVTVKNGQLENTGNQTAVIGFAFPGMQENLNLSPDKLEIPSFVEISADVENFELGPTMTVATTSLLKEVSAESFDIQALKEQAKKLTDGMSQLMDGAGKLYDGLNTLLEQTDAMVNGVSQLSSGATQLQTGTDTLTGGVSQLQAGASQLSAGLDQLNANSDALNAGAEQVFHTLLSTATAQLQAAGISVPPLTIGNYAEVLNGVIASLDETAVYQAALEQVTAGVEARRGEIEAAVTDAVRQQVTVQAMPLVTAAVREAVTAAVAEQEPLFRAIVILRATGLTPEAYQLAVKAGLISEEKQAEIEAAILAAMEAEVAKQMDSDDVQAKIAAITEEKVSEKMKSEEIQTMIAENVEIQVQKIISETMASPEVQEKLQAAAEGAQSVISLKSSLDSYNGFYLGLLTYTAGVSTAASGAADLNTGAETLRSGMASLSSGAAVLHDGIQSLNAKMPELTAGITALRDGSGTLQDGLTKLMEEGIQKIADLAQEDMSDLAARLNACLEAADSYSSFSGKSEGAAGTVKFIYKTGSVSANGE